MGILVFDAPENHLELQDEAPKIAKLPYKWLNYGLWFMVDIIIVNEVYKPAYNWGAPSLGYIHLCSMFQTLFSDKPLFHISRYLQIPSGYLNRPMLNNPRVISIFAGDIT